MAFNGFGGLFNDAGWTFKSTKRKKAEDIDLQKNQIIELENDDASELIDSTHFSQGTALSHATFSTQAEYINEYRSMSLHPEVDNAVDDIVNEMISANDDEPPIQLDLTDVEISDAVKEKILAAHERLMGMMRMSTTAYEKGRQFYVDGRLVYHIIIDMEKPSEGIKKLVMLDPRATKRVKEIRKEVDPTTRVEKIVDIQEYFIYNGAYSFDNTDNKRKVNNTHGTTAGYGKSFDRPGQQLRLSKDSVVMVHSGLLASDSNMILSHLEKARKALNNLKMMEDAIVIYRITRAPERRVFYIDVGSLPAKSAEAYVKGVMDKYKTKFTYDPVSGKTNGTPHEMSMLENFWLPRREGSQGTQIDTLPGGDNLGSIDDVMYFKRNLYKALNVPQSRLEQESASIVLGGPSGGEITRDEWKFGKFINRLRRRFNHLPLEVLKRELLLTKVTNEEDWTNIIEPFIKVIYPTNTYMKEQQEIETFMSKITALRDARELEGRYFSRATLYQNIFKMTEEEVQKERELIDAEIKQKLYVDPVKSDENEMDNGGGF